MRVLLVSHRFPPDGIVGVERITQTLASELTKLGDDVTVATRRFPPSANGAAPETVRERLPDGTPLHRFTGGTLRLEGFLDHNDRLEQLFIRALVEAAPDVVHVMHLMGQSPRLVQIARSLGCAVVVSLQDFYFVCPLVLLRKPSGELCDGPDGGRECASTCYAGEGDRAPLRWGLRSAYFRHILLQADRFISPSDYVADYFEPYGLDPGRMRVIPNGVSIGPDGALDGRRTPSDRGRLNLAFLGSVIEHKGVHVLLEAVRLAGLGPVDLLVAGDMADPAYTERLRAQAEEIPGLTMRLHGGYELSILEELLEDVDCLVTPSQWPETFGIVVREALVRGIPVAVARVGGLQEAVEEGVNGYTFTSDQPGELAAILQRVAGDDELLASLRRGARETTVMTVAEHAAAVREVYEEALIDRADSDPATGDEDELSFLHAALVEAGFGEGR